MLLSGGKPDAREAYNVSYAVIEAIAEAEEIDATAIEPPKYESLYDVLNPEALDALFKPRRNGAPRANGCIEFTFCGYDVVVTSDGDVEIVE